MLQLLWTAATAALAVCTCFAFALRTLDSAAIARHGRKPASAFFYAVLAAIPAAICLAAVAAAVLVLLVG